MLSVIYQDDWLVAIDKPSGLLSVPGRGADKQDCALAQLASTIPTARCVHRLDRDTSGVLLVALDVESHRDLGRQFEQRAVEKRYTAIVAGCVTVDEGRIEAPLAKDLSAPPRHCVDLTRGRSAATEFRVLAREPERTRLELRPLTGRSHQLRVHLQHVGHPILGDPLYGSPATHAAASRLMLHAIELIVRHPAHGTPLILQAACPF